MAQNECIIRAEEFEFQWWDHAFNKAAKSVKVEEGKNGQVKVDSSKDELSTTAGAELLTSKCLRSAGN